MHKHLLETIKSSDRSSFSDGLLVIAPYLKVRQLLRPLEDKLQPPNIFFLYRVQLYTEYVNNHPAAISLLIELNANSKKFAALLKVLSANVLPGVQSRQRKPRRVLA